jgi:hypothetical protein
MDSVRIAAVVFSALTVCTVGFQLALAAGAPWGAYAMGGRSPGRFPPALRVAAVVQAFVLALLAAIVLLRAGLMSPRWASASAGWVWVVVAVSGLSLVLNSITPSVRERRIWAPAALVMLVSSAVVALGA